MWSGCGTVVWSELVVICQVCLFISLQMEMTAFLTVTWLKMSQADPTNSRTVENSVRRL